jgi:filamentous hemagglutinin
MKNKSNQTISKWVRLGALTLSLNPAFAIDSIVTPDAAAANRPQVSSQSGTPIVNITAPNSAGVSMNQYSRFDVGTQGVVLNNATTSTTSSKGLNIAANANLSNGAASVIVNQVNSANPSYINGLLEVAGTNAHVIVANPSGIVSNGGQIVNANRITLSTGTVALNATGSLDLHRVRGGNINIQGTGFSAPNANFTELFSRTAQITATLNGGADLNVVAGINDISANGATVTNRSNSTHAASRPTVSIDTGLLGGMYAGKISLRSTESGVGVNHSGRSYATSATTGNFTISASGKITNSGVIGSRNTNLTSNNSSIENSGTIEARYGTNGTITLRANRGNVTNNGTLYATSNITLAGNSFSSGETSNTESNRGNISLQSSTYAAFNGTWKAYNNLTASSATMTFDSTNLTGNNVTLNATQSMMGNASSIRAFNNLSLSTASATFYSSALLALSANADNGPPTNSDSRLTLNTTNFRGSQNTLAAHELDLNVANYGVYYSDVNQTVYKLGQSNLTTIIWYKYTPGASQFEPTTIFDPRLIYSSYTNPYGNFNQLKLFNPSVIN